MSAVRRERYRNAHQLILHKSPRPIGSDYSHAGWLSANRREWKDYFITHGFADCSICGSEFNVFKHHVDPSSKEFDIGAFCNTHAFNLHNLLIVERELEKCIPLCRSCHRSLHNSFQNPRSKK